MVMKLIKIASGVTLLVIGLLLVAPFFINVNSYRPQIAKAVEDATGRKLEIGNIKASLFPWVGLSLERVNLANRSGFSQQPFLKIASIDVRVELLPLFSKQLKIRQFKLESPEIYLERNEQGEGSWQDLTGSTSSPPPAEAKPGESTVEKPELKASNGKTTKSNSLLTALKAESMQLNNGRFIWMDQTVKRKLEVSDIRIEVTDLQLERPVPFAVSAGVGGDEIHLAGQVGPLGDLGKIDPSKLPLQAKLECSALGLKQFSQWIPELPEFIGKRESASLSFSVQAEQRPDGKLLSVGRASLTDAMTMDLDWHLELPYADRVDLHEINVGVNGSPLLKAQGEIRTGDSFRYQFRMKSSEITRQWLTTIFPDLATMYEANSAPWKSVKLGALISGNADSVELRDVQVGLDQELLQLTGSVGFTGGPDMSLRLTSPELHLDPWLPAAKEKEDGPATVESELAGVAGEVDEPDLRQLATWGINSRISIDHLYAKGLQLEQFRARVTGRRGVLNIDPLTFSMDSGEVNEKASLDVNSYPAKWSESLHVQNLKIEPILATLADMDMLSGRLQLDAELRGKGLLSEAIFSTLTGHGKVALTDGSVKGFDIAGSMRNLTSLGRNSDSRQTDFAQLTGSFTVRNGRVKNSDLFMASPLFRLTGNGTVDLPAKRLDYHVKPRLVGTLTGQGDTVAVRKGLAVPLRIYGLFESPKIAYEGDRETLLNDAHALGREKVSEAAESAKKRLEDAAKRKLETQKVNPAVEQKARKALQKLLPGF